MKFMKWSKAGGPKSTVHGFFFVEIKPLFSIVLLKFDGPSRDAYLSQPFSCFSWLLKGRLTEKMMDGGINWYLPKIRPFITRKPDFHKVDRSGNSWVLSFRGPWDDKWYEWTDNSRLVELTHGRKEGQV